MLKTFLCVLLLSGSCLGQQNSPSFNWRTRLPSDPAITKQQRVQLVLHNNFLSASAAMRVLGPAMVGQMVDSPPEWDRTASGFGRRLGTQFAMQTSRGLIAAGSAAVFRRDPRYERCDCRGFPKRMVYALSGTVLAADGSGRRRFDPSNLLSAYGAGYVGANLYPDRYRVSVKGYQLGTQQVGAVMFQNVLLEFWPDIRRLIRTRALRR
jgi:hypothetical protein